MVPRARISRRRSRNNKSARKIASTYFCVIKCGRRWERRNFSRYSRRGRVGTGVRNYHSLIEPPGTYLCSDLGFTNIRRTRRKKMRCKEPVKVNRTGYVTAAYYWAASFELHFNERVRIIALSCVSEFRKQIAPIS